MLFYIPLIYTFIFIWFFMCNDYQEQIEELLDGENKKKDENE